MTWKDISIILSSLGFILDEEQPHMSGERFLMMREKFVLVGRAKDSGTKAVIKISNVPSGVEEVRKEKRIRDRLNKPPFVSERLLFPKELYYGEKQGYASLIIEFIPQEKVFAAYPLEDQVAMSVRVLEQLQKLHADNEEYRRAAREVFEIYDASGYLENFSGFQKSIRSLSKDKKLAASLLEAKDMLSSGKKLIDAHADYLVHGDLVPGNMRIKGKEEIYMLDLSSLSFGNKYESWARFLNWALVHSPKLEKALVGHVKSGLGETDYLCLRLMRIYKSAFLIDYYARSLGKTTGDLRSLTEKRLEFWHCALRSFIDDQPLSEDKVQAYREERNELRSTEETERQKDINIPTL